MTGGPGSDDARDPLEAELFADAHYVVELLAPRRLRGMLPILLDAAREDRLLSAGEADRLRERHERRRRRRARRRPPRDAAPPPRRGA